MPTEIFTAPQKTMAENSKPRYQQIADELRHEIESGRYAIGSLLPTELQLRVLINDRMVERRQGSGTLVTASSRQRFNQSISSVADLLQYGANTRLKVVDTHRVNADGDLAALLNCPVGTPCIHLHGLRSESKGARPFCVSDIYRVAEKDGLTKRLLEVRGAVYALIEELDIGHIGSVEQNINAGVLSPEQCAELGVPRRTVCLRIVRRYFDPNGKLIVVAVNQHPGNDFVYSMSLTQSH
jgi:GntR family transcriptional regulator